MKINSNEAQIGRVTNLLLFVRTTDDLARSCRQVEEFFAFCRNRQSGSFADGRLLGAWIDEHAVTELPQEMELRLSTNDVVMLAVRETFSLWGVWSVASIEPMCMETKAGVELSHDRVFDALFAFTRGDSESIGRYSPAFAHDTSKKQVRAEIKRLNTRYPLRIEQPIYYDPVTGELSLQNERLHH
ncbi:MAG: hypothetical protein HO274_07705 [Ferrovum myxofaciens]|uniref:hypothetical protein n=1 Tax=Ferrovum myxofaciens TaxID=416213 RepID=UPI0023542537|nr:hypothetical protein [Ferrovum myxofaciens]QKE41202.1 MAG: hypothetical protein HO274_07705 [Ferrovum myxofaciens]